jgi:hypothetical protein
LGGELFYICYDGNAVGSFKSDITRTFSINFGPQGGVSQDHLGVYSNAGFSASNNIAAGSGTGVDTIYAKLIGNFGNETAPASLSALYCISY